MDKRLIIANLEQSIRDENKAARDYRSRKKTADSVTARLYEHIAHEEDVHAREFAERLAKVKRDL